VIEEELASEKKIYEKTALSEERVMMFRERMATSTHSLINNFGEQ
jgi:hypothetical protein